MLDATIFPASLFDSCYIIQIVMHLLTFYVSTLYSRAHKYRSDQEHVRAPTLMRSASLCSSGGPSQTQQVNQHAFLCTASLAQKALVAHEWRR